eukprot:3144688-Rhodomonas_salina.1
MAAAVEYFPLHAKQRTVSNTMKNVRCAATSNRSEAKHEGRQVRAPVAAAPWTYEEQKRSSTGRWAECRTMVT